MNDISYLK